jgi:hypothetical protein
MLVEMGFAGIGVICWPFSECVFRASLQVADGFYFFVSNDGVWHGGVLGARWVYDSRQSRSKIRFRTHYGIVCRFASKIPTFAPLGRESKGFRLRQIQKQGQE